MEVIKLITGIGEPLVGRLLLYDALGGALRHDPLQEKLTAWISLASILHRAAARGFRPLGRAARPDLRAFAYMDGVIDPPSSAHLLTPETSGDKASQEICVPGDCTDDRLVGCVFAPSETIISMSASWPSSLSFRDGASDRLLDGGCRRSCPQPSANRRIELQTRVELTANHAAFPVSAFAKPHAPRMTAMTGRPRSPCARRWREPCTSTAEEQAIAAGAMATARRWRCASSPKARALLGAPRLIPIASAHIDGALYHGDSGTLFAERLVEGGAKVAVRSTLNVGALDLMGCSRVRLEEPAARHGAAHDGGLSQARLRAELDLRALSGRPPAGPRHATSPGANPTPSCSAIRCSARAPTAMAISSTSPARSSGRAPDYGLHRTGKPPGDGWCSTSPACPHAFLGSEIAWPVLGSLYGREVGNAVGVVTGVVQPSRRGCAEGVRRGGRLVGRGRPVPHRRRDAGSARRRDRRWPAAGRKRSSASRRRWPRTRARGLSTAASADRHRRGGDRQPASVARPNSTRWSG